MSQFPTNPANGTIFELKPGVFYQYDASINSWMRIEGLLTPPVASVVNDGLMSAGDFQKLNRLIVPPPQSTLTAEDCSSQFSAGTIAFKSGDNFFEVAGGAPLQNAAADCITEPVNFQMHQHTYFFDFTIDINSLFDYMKDEGKFVVRSKRGPKGPPGDPGVDGLDALPFGPDGEQGDKGTNAPVSFSLTSEPVNFSVKSKYKRAIVEIDVEPVDDSEYFLVVKRANVGNPVACPNRVRLNSDTNSTWVLAVGDLASDPGFVNFNFVNDNTPDECFVCNTELFYLDVAPLIAAIRNEFDLEVLRLKQGFEEIVTFWLNIMSGLFDEQKAALCCALEYCRSQQRNNDTRRYIESQRIQAAVSGSTIAIDGSPADDDKNVTILDPACEPDGFGSDTDNGIPNNADPIGGAPCVPGLIVDNSDGRRAVLKYAQCPPGFVPRSEARKRYGGADAGDDTIFIQSADPRYQQTLHELRGDDTAALARPIGIDPVNVSIHQTVDDTGFIHYDAWYVNDMRRTPESASLGNMAMTGNKELIEGGRCLQFSDSLIPGLYTIYLSNRSNKRHGFTLRISSQNAQFVRGEGDGWNDEYILSSGYDEAGNAYASNTIIECESGPNNNKGWWLQIRVHPEKPIIEPYSSKCGSIGPRPTQLDTRLCKEVPKGVRDPLMRDTMLDVSYRGAMQDWVTTKCGKFLVPDAVEINLSTDKLDTKRVILCRTNLGNYTGGFNDGEYSAQIMIEQQNAPEVKPKSSRLYSHNYKDNYNSADDITGSSRYKCTILLWKGMDCKGDVFSYATEVVTAECENWNLKGRWSATGVGPIEFSASELENDNNTVQIPSASTSELLLYVSARKNVHDKRRRTAGKLPRGRYTVDIVNCCLSSGKQHTGHVEIEFNNNGERAAKRFPTLGTFTDSVRARGAYVGLTMDIDHAGGDVAAALVSPITQIGEGEIVVRFSGAQSYEHDIITPVPQARVSDECRMHVGHVRWLEDAWRRGDCSGVVVEVADQDYIVVCTGKKLNTQCMLKYKTNGLAYAWPTFDGEEFIAIPDSGSVGFKNNMELQQAVLDAIRDGRVSSVRGKSDDIKTVLFPIADV